MIDNQGLKNLVVAAVGAGARIVTTYDVSALRDEGREIIDTVTVSGVSGIGPHPMSAIAAAERLREFLVDAYEYLWAREICRRQALHANEEGTFDTFIAEVAMFEFASELQRKGIEADIVPITLENVMGRAKLIWQAFWDDVVVVDVSQSTTQRAVQLLHKRERIESFDNSNRGYPIVLCKNKVNPWQLHTMKEFKPILVCWMAKARPDIFNSIT